MIGVGHQSRELDERVDVIRGDGAPRDPSGPSGSGIGAVEEGSSGMVVLLSVIRPGYRDPVGRGRVAGRTRAPDAQGGGGSRDGAVLLLVGLLRGVGLDLGGGLVGRLRGVSSVCSTASVSSTGTSDSSAVASAAGAAAAGAAAAGAVAVEVRDERTFGVTGSSTSSICTMGRCRPCGSRAS
ncbi:hypothetical protein BC477_04440 [Clavibacter michiganensis subsp. michiganensis]|uniref:Uncharacterized protein n=1 Tax=Clavibacter michiganensis subsp. michiganensis TaxID=33013 RepID=A0A251XKF6_CLAMM|nr:hypothetical protein BC477_04440 [Clavibacter michiganensis subsp. michiganensis]OUE03961.1 hypothetical protein CMMCAS07_03370 [Clavibacter michiganensis subsp. michiganensis]